MASGGDSSREFDAPGIPGHERVAPAQPLTPAQRVERIAASFAPELSRSPDLIVAARRRALDRLAASGEGEPSVRAACVGLAAELVVTLGAEGLLTADDTRSAAADVARYGGGTVASARLDLFTACVHHRMLLELPPVVAAGIVMRLVLELGSLSELSLFRRSPTDQIEVLLHLGSEAPSRRARAEARGILEGRTLVQVVGRGTLASAPVQLLGSPHAALVGRPLGDPGVLPTVLVGEAAAALSPVLEREFLLVRSGERERAMVTSAEKRLMRLGFDLHDGPVQDVLALSADVRYLRDQIDPFVMDSHRELAYGRFEDLLSRLEELDRQLREYAHSLESKSIVSRPLGEVLHREIDAFGERTGIVATLEVRGDPESLTAAQRIALFRAIQETLANVREHSGASHVEIRIRARRSSIEARIVDDGAGFEVSRALSRAAQRGRLGLIGIGERVRMLGGTFEIDSKPGGPTTLAISLPRWEPFVPPADR